MIPSARVTVQQRWSFDELLAIPASLALIRVMCVAQSVGVELEKIPKIVLGKMTSGILCLVDDAC